MASHNGIPVGIHEIVIHVRDVQKSLAFYKDILQFKILHEDEGLVWLLVGEGERGVQVLLHPWAEEIVPFGNMALAFRYENVDAVVACAKEANVVIEMEPKDLWYGWYGAREAALRDPDGIYIFLAEPLLERPKDV